MKFWGKAFTFINSLLLAAFLGFLANAAVPNLHAKIHGGAETHSEHSDSSQAHDEKCHFYHFLVHFAADLQPVVLSFNAPSSIPAPSSDSFAFDLPTLHPFLGRAPPLA